MEIKGLFSFTMNVFRFPFSFIARVFFNVFFLCYVSISALFPVQFNQFKFNFVK